MHLPNGPLARPHSLEHESFPVYAPITYYCLESHLFEDVDRRFHTDHSIGALDSFSLVIWKANRAKLNRRQSCPRGRRSITRRA